MGVVHGELQWDVAEAVSTRGGSFVGILICNLVQGDPPVGFDFDNAGWGLEFVELGEGVLDKVSISLSEVLGMPPGLKDVDDIG